MQIGDGNVHHVREVLDEIFGSSNFVSLITFRKKTMDFGAKYLEGMSDYLLLYARDKNILKFRKMFLPQNVEGLPNWKYVELPDGTIRELTPKEWFNHKILPLGSKVFRPAALWPSGYSENMDFEVEFKGKIYRPVKGRCWTTTPEGMDLLIKSNRILEAGNNLYYKLYLNDYPVKGINNLWSDTSGPKGIKYIVETNRDVIARCLLMTTDPGDLVFDPTCGSGTTAYVAEQWGRRWITCDTSRVATTLAKQRLITAMFDYYELAHPKEGVISGFKYKSVKHITLGSIANNEPPAQETLYDQPFVDKSKVRVSGPFTVEAVPAPVVKPLSEVKEEPSKDESVARSGETLRQSEWRDELFRTGIRGKSGQRIEFSRVEMLSGTRWLHADAETKEDNPQRAVVSFGPEHAPLEQRQVELAIEEARRLVPKPKIIVFATFQFDPEASKDIDETEWPGVTLLKAQMNADLLTKDLKKKRASNESFWLMGQPDVSVEKIKDGKDKGKNRVDVLGFDYYNTKTGTIESGGTEKIAMWMLDTDYDGRSLFPRQVFFPMASEKEGWSRLAKNLKAEISEELIEAYRGSVSLPFEPGDNRRIAVKIIDDRGIESFKIVEV